MRDALQLVDDGEHADRGGFVGNAEAFEKKKPQRAVAEPDAEIALFQPEGAQRLDAKRDDLGVRGAAGLSENVRVVLVKRAQTPALLLFVAVVFADAEPLDRPAQRSRASGDEPRERRGHFRAQRNFSPALVFKIEELRNDFLAGFFGEKLERLQRRRVPFPEAEALGRFAPAAENVIAHGAVLRVELAKTGKRFELHGKNDEKG